MPTKKSLLAPATAALLALLSLAADASAQIPTSTEWQNSGTGLWTTEENWTSYVSEGETFYISPAAGIDTSIGQGTSQILSGSQATGNLWIEAESGTATLSISGGSLNTTGSADVGVSEGTIGAVTVSSADWTIDGDLYLGSAGAGTVTLTDGATGSAAFTELGREATGNGTLAIDGGGEAGTIWTTNTLCIGGDGTGSVSILNGGEVQFFAGTGGSICVGDGYEGTNLNTLTVSGAGSKILDSEFGTSLTVGNGTRGLMTVSAGGLVEAFSTEIGNNSEGTVEVSGDGSIWRSGYSLIGIGNDGTLTVSDGGRVESTTVQMGIASYDFDGSETIRVPGQGLVTVTGEGSIWEISGENFGDGTLDFYAGELSVEDGGTVIARNMTMVTEAEDTATMTITGEDSIVRVEASVTEDSGVDGGEFVVGGMGTASVSVLAGGQLVTENALISGTWTSAEGEPLSGGLGQVTVSGAGSVWDADASHRTDDYLERGFIAVGVSGEGKLFVEDGGVVRSAYGALGVTDDLAPGRGEATITGSGSLWELVTTDYGDDFILGGELVVGGSGIGDLSILNGGAVTARTVYVNYSDTFDAGLGGSILVDGTGSTLDVTAWEFGTEHFYDYYDGGELLIGETGVGTLTVSAGGKVSSLYGGIGVGFDEASNGTATVTGAGSEWIVGQQWGDSEVDGFLFALQVGGGESGILNIEDGGLVRTWGATVNQSGQITVTGEGSQFLVEGRVYDDPEFGEFMLSGVLANAGNILVEDGGLMTSRGSYLSDDSTLTVTGEDSEWSIIGEIGNDGIEGDRYLIGGELDSSGQVTVSDGGTIRAVSVWGYGSASLEAPSVITVTGAGSQLLATPILEGVVPYGGEIEIGRAGISTLNIEDGGFVQSFIGGVGLSETYYDSENLPYEEYGTGYVNITGSGSEWEVTGDTVTVGGAGEGHLTVAEFGRLTVGGGTGDVLVAAEAGSIGVVRIGDGTGFAGDLDAASITGGAGDATLVFDHTDTAYTFANGAGDGIAIGGSLKVVANEGTTILETDSTYTGGTTIDDAATLEVRSNQALGAGNVEIRSGGTLIVTESVALDIGAGNSVTLQASDALYVKNFGVGESLVNYGEVSSMDGTTARFLDGEAASGGAIYTSYVDAPVSENGGLVRSSVFSLDNLGSVPFVLEITIATSTDGLALGWFDENDTGLWLNAVEGNSGNVATSLQQNYAGSFEQFQLNYGLSLVSYMGAWGHDGTSVWAVLNHNSDFAVVPEPSTMGLLVCGGVLLAAVRRRRLNA